MKPNLIKEKQDRSSRPIAGDIFRHGPQSTLLRDAFLGRREGKPYFKWPPKRRLPISTHLHGRRVFTAHTCYMYSLLCCGLWFPPMYTAPRQGVFSVNPGGRNQAALQTPPILFETELLSRQHATTENRRNWNMGGVGMVEAETAFTEQRTSLVS